MLFAAAVFCSPSCCPGFAALRRPRCARPVVLFASFTVLLCWCCCAAPLRRVRPVRRRAGWLFSWWLRHRSGGWLLRCVGSAVAAPAAGGTVPGPVHVMVRRYNCGFLRPSGGRCSPTPKDRAKEREQGPRSAPREGKQPSKRNVHSPGAANTMGPSRTHTKWHPLPAAGDYRAVCGRQSNTTLAAQPRTGKRRHQGPPAEAFKGSRDGHSMIWTVRSRAYVSTARRRRAALRPGFGRYGDLSRGRRAGRIPKSPSAGFHAVVPKIWATPR